METTFTDAQPTIKDRVIWAVGVVIITALFIGSLYLGVIG
jgi:hypothetical protein